MTAATIDPGDPGEVVVVVLGGGRGSRLHPLTRDRAKPAVGFGGKYRLIDFTLTNCLRSGFEKVFILTQFNSFSLNRHVWQAYSREVAHDGFVEVVAAAQTAEREDWFQGTADAVRRSLRVILERRPRRVLILAADQLYRMDFRALLAGHVARGSDVTIAAHHVAPDRLRPFGVVAVDREARVIDFREKPAGPDQVAGFRLDRAGVGHPDGRPFLASMGLYLFETGALLRALDGDEPDFGKQVIPQVARAATMHCHMHAGYWEDIGTIEAYYRASMEWVEGGGAAAAFADGAVLTHARQLPPTRVVDARITRASIADGGVLHGAEIARSIVGVRARVGPGTTIADAVLMGNDHPFSGTPEIGAGCTVRRAIVDKNAVLGDGCVIANEAGVREADADLYAIRAGIVVIPRGAVLPPGTRI